MESCPYLKDGKTYPTKWHYHTLVKCQNLIKKSFEFLYEMRKIFSPTLSLIFILFLINVGYSMLIVVSNPCVL